MSLYDANILCVDPGGTTGVVILQVPKDQPAQVRYSAEIEGSIEGITAVFKYWQSQSHLGINWYVVCEDWSYIHGRPTDARLACFPIAWLEMRLWDLNTNHKLDIPIIMQMPRFRTSIPDDRATLKPLGYWIGMEGHARQALRHGLAYIVRAQKHRPTMEHLFPRPQSAPSS